MVFYYSSPALLHSFHYSYYYRAKYPFHMNNIPYQTKPTIYVCLKKELRFRWGSDWSTVTKCILSLNFASLSSNFVASSGRGEPSAGVSSRRRRWPHWLKFSRMLAPTSYSEGRMFTKAMISGATTNSIKPICMLHRLMASRSHIGDTSRPRDFSLSPCRQNSSTTRSAHLAHKSYGLNGLLMSLQWRINSMINMRFLSSLMQSMTSFPPAQKACVSAPCTSRNT
mmetsp:Transcript_57079/g.100220  ORF Transcript_57079/g.100220 Transcript_57079/m.100220 type:complete len:225 (+) Transcript_57079:233-907(+)